MKKSQLKAIVKEEIKNIIKEDVNSNIKKDYNSYKAKWIDLQNAFKAYKNEITKNMSGPNKKLKQIEIDLLDFHLETDELVSTYGYDRQFNTRRN